MDKRIDPFEIQCIQSYLYIDFKWSNEKAKFVPREYEINRDVTPYIEIINYTRGGIVMFFTEKKGNAFFGGQIQVPDAGPGADWLS